jgi:hypothetical protein
MPIATAPTAASGIEVSEAMTTTARMRTIAATSSEEGAPAGAAIAMRIAATPLSRPAVTHTRCVVRSTFMPNVEARSRFSADARIAMPASLRRK